MAATKGKTHRGPDDKREDDLNERTRKGRHEETA